MNSFTFIRAALVNSKIRHWIDDRDDPAICSPRCQINDTVKSKNVNMIRGLLRWATTKIRQEVDFINILLCL